MATIKGQNLRLFLDGKCVAASTSCTFHVAAQTEDVSTKDSEGDWAENEVTGFSFDASADALVSEWGYLHEYDLEIEGGQEVQFEEGSEYGYIACFAYDDGDQKYTVYGNDGSRYDSFSDKGLFVYIKPGVEYSIVNKEDYLIWCSYRDDKGSNGQFLENIFTIMLNKQKIPFSLSTTKGGNNREEDEQLLSGNLICTDLSVSSGNRQNVTFSASFTGTGALSIE